MVKVFLWGGGLFSLVFWCWYLAIKFYGFLFEIGC